MGVTSVWGMCSGKKRDDASFFILSTKIREYMKIVASLTDPAQASRAKELGADIIELRFDLAGNDPLTCVQVCRDACSLPIIGTIRSAPEGGTFFGDAAAWLEKICPVIPLVDYIDMEQRFASCAAQVRESGTAIIASHHTGKMLSLPDLFALERDLRTYGNIVKIVVTPGNEGDILELLEFTHAVKKPVCTGVMGAQFRYARAILPLFGSGLVYCHTGTITAVGQYSVQEFISIMTLLKNG
jgi:3-dehydroquinate dehydratase-1